jgi:arsenical pump membrane protein
MAMSESNQTKLSSKPKLQPAYLIAPIGIAAALASLISAPLSAHRAADQAWPPFALVAGLLLVGSVAASDGIFKAAGDRLAGLSRSGIATYLGVLGALVVVTASLNLDTAVVFVTPVLIAMARRRGSGMAPLLYASIFMANASSLFLPGSNLTNLIVLANGRRSGASFVALMTPAAIGAAVATGLGLTIWGRHELRSDLVLRDETSSFHFGLGALGILLATVLSVALSSPALPVAGLGLLLMTIRMIQRRQDVHSAAEVLGGPVLIGLFGLAVAMGTLGRVWGYPSHELAQSGGVATAVIAALAAVLLNNLPAASLLAAHHPNHPAQLLVGLNVGPNLFVTGSLAWFLWFRVAKSNGATPSLWRATRLGLVLAPLAMAAALLCLALA